MKRLALSVVPAALLLLSSAHAHATDIKACIKSAEASQDLRDKGQYLRARQELLTCSNEGCPAQVRSDCLSWLAELDRQAPSVVVHPKGPKGDDLVDVAVFLDGEKLVPRLDGKPILVDPGAHTFRYETQGFAPVEQKILVNAGEKMRVLDVKFGDAAVTKTTQPEPPHDKPTSGGPPTMAWVLGGVAVVALGTSAVFGISGLSKRSELWDDACSTTKTCSQSDVDGVKTKFLIADVAGAVGIVSAAVATYLFVSAPKAGSSSTTVGVGLVPGGGAVRWGGAF